MQKLMVAIDGSESAGRALALAEDLASKFGACLRVVTVVEPPYVPIESYGFAGEADEARRDEGRDLLQRALDGLHARGIEADALLLEGAAADAIARQADEYLPDLLVIGSHGRKAVSRLLLGSVSTTLVHHLHRPLLVVP